jgi:hypothetical protein
MSLKKHLEMEAKKTKKLTSQKSNIGDVTTSKFILSFTTNTTISQLLPNAFGYFDNKYFYYNPNLMFHMGNTIICTFHITPR